MLFTPGYGHSRRVHAGSGGARGASGRNRKMGARGSPLTELVGAFIDAGPRVGRFEEFGGTIVPWNINVEATKDPSAQPSA